MSTPENETAAGAVAAKEVSAALPPQTTLEIPDALFEVIRVPVHAGERDDHVVAVSEHDQDALRERRKLRGHVEHHSDANPGLLLVPPDVAPPPWKLPKQAPEEQDVLSPKFGQVVPRTRVPRLDHSRCGALQRFEVLRCGTHATSSHLTAPAALDGLQSES